MEKLKLNKQNLKELRGELLATRKEKYIKKDFGIKPEKIKNQTEEQDVEENDEEEMGM